MEDRVAEVLAQRTALDNGTAAGVILSLLLHGGIAGAAVYAALRAPAPKIASVLNIKFAPMPEPVVVAPPKAVVPRIEEPKPEPVKPIETKKAPEKGTVPLSPFGKSKKKGSENPIPPPRPTTNDQRPTSPGVTAALEGGDFPYTIYIERMKTLIGSRWFRPQVGGGVVVVYFAIDRDGTIRDTRIETPSGDGTFDRAALRAVLESSPLPPLPFGYAGTYLGVHLTFR
ncbi:MAG TPA: TonB family protein [Thermoanaerobaculia bacterium]|nr:TonB family protein [Thermoanaerobaculia bacterium]